MLADGDDEDTSKKDSGTVKRKPMERHGGGQVLYKDREESDGDKKI